MTRRADDPQIVRLAVPDLERQAKALLILLNRAARLCKEGSGDEKTLAAATAKVEAVTAGYGPCKSTAPERAKVHYEL